MANINSITLTDCTRNSSGIQLRDYTDQIDLAVKIYEVIIESADIHFGVKASSLSDALIRAVVQDIIKNYNTLTLTDIEYSFERFAKQRTDWRNLTKSDLIQPIQQYSVIKMKIKSEMRKMQEEDEYEIEKQKKIREFEEKSIDCYNVSLDLGKWTGDIFQAKAIYRKFKGKISDEVIADLKKETVKRFRILDEKKKLEYTLYTADRIYANLIVEYGIANNIKI